MGADIGSFGLRRGTANTFAKFPNKKPASKAGFSNSINARNSSTLAGFEALVDFVDDVITAPAADKLIVAVPSHQRAKRIPDFHVQPLSGKNKRALNARNLGPDIGLKPPYVNAGKRGNSPLRHAKLSVRKMAGGKMSIDLFFHQRFLLGAQGLRLGATRSEHAAGRRIERRRQFPLDQFNLAAQLN